MHVKLNVWISLFLFSSSLSWYPFCCRCLCSIQYSSSYHSFPSLSPRLETIATSSCKTKSSQTIFSALYSNEIDRDHLTSATPTQSSTLSSTTRKACLATSEWNQKPADSIARPLWTETSCVMKFDSAVILPNPVSSTSRWSSNHPRERQTSSDASLTCRTQMTTLLNSRCLSSQ